MKKKIAILGSTGSIGTQTIDVIRQHKDKFEIEILTANSNVNTLIKQALEFNPNAVVIAQESYYKQLQSALSNTDIKVYAGSSSIEQITEMDTINIVVNAMVGFSGFLPTVRALKSNKIVALANKETIVAGGELITKLLKNGKNSILPIDSEHSAIFQCLTGESFNSINKLILTASGGPFKNKTINDLKHITPEDALKHPIWNMGKKISIDSATLMNKGLEVIEAKWLFGVEPSQIEVVIHPQSIIHSMVEFKDKSIKAQMGLPDMRTPIQYALSYPERLNLDLNQTFSFDDITSLTFEKPDKETFKCLQLAYNSLSYGGNMPCIMNAANEVAVDMFLNHKIQFLEIPEVIQYCMQKVHHDKNPDFETLINTHFETIKIAIDFIKKLKK